MIVLDTNQLDRHSLNSPLMAILKVLARVTNHRLAVSEVTYNEHCAHFEYRLRSAHAQQNRARKDMRALLKAAGQERERWDLESATRTEKFIDRHIASYKNRISNVFDVVRLDGESAIEALRREACRIAPASTSFDTKGSGARDAAIWLSLIRKSTESSEKIFFVSADRQAFSSSAITADYNKSGSSIVILDDIRELLEALADRVDVDVSQSSIEESETIHQKVFDQLVNYTGILGNVMTASIDSQPHSSIQFFDYSNAATVEFMRVEEARGHAVGGDGVWATARVRWAVSFKAPLQRHMWGVDGGSEPITQELWALSFQIVSTLLFKVDDENEAIEVLDFGKPSKISSELEELNKRLL
jgi:hypothetical protein